MISYEDRSGQHLHHGHHRHRISPSHMAHYIAMVRYGDDWVRIKRKGLEPVYLVSEADMKLIWDRSDDMDAGPRDAETGERSGRGLMYWVRQGFRRDRGG